MTHVTSLTLPHESDAPVSRLGAIPSPLILCDRLLTLAQDADRAGCAITAENLVQLAHSVLDEQRPH
jgi:hypothetical protein